MAEDGNMNSNTAEGLRRLNKDLLTRNAELVKRLNRMKTERDNFEQLFMDWKKVNKDASETINLLQRDNEVLKGQLEDERLENQALRQQMEERVQQNNVLLRDLRRLNTLRFDHQQQKHETEQLLRRLQGLFLFVDANYPHITRTKGSNALHGIREHNNSNAPDDADGDGYDDDFSSKRQRTKRPRQQRSKAAKRRKRRSLPMAVSTHQIAQLAQRERREPQRDKRSQSQAVHPAHRLVIDHADRDREEPMANGSAERIAPQLLGPSTTAREHPFKKTVSSQSFFSEQQQRYHYTAVQMNLPGTKLWTKRDSLTGKRKKARINAIPSSAGSTPLTTPQQSRRGHLDDDYEEPQFDEDPHHRYLEMLGRPDDAQDTDSASTDSLQHAPPPNGAASASGASERSKLTDKKTVHDLFDMLQQHTLANVAGMDATAAVAMAEPGRPGRDEREHCNGSPGDAQLVPILEPSESSSDSDCE